MANKADREQPIVYLAWCEGAGQSERKGVTEVCAIDAMAAARIHAERMTDADFRKANRSKRGEDPWIHVFVKYGSNMEMFVVARIMQPVFEARRCTEKKK